MKQIGTVGVDAGMLYLGDPCYVIDRPLGRMAWEDFLAALYADGSIDAPHWTVQGRVSEASPRTFPAGIVVTTGGDGEFPVFAEIEDGRVRRVIIDFGREET